ncbi:dTDP-4-amino-4,6-dideoxygalactose transaminase [Vibrio sp. 10N.261.52.F3]|uniref:dTDP-4-amino-4,6-dideoxygalactose transaminase n=1 Tax=Vibrio sp. 10N.261.52.F3 TaxID=3229683 RepID=UPI00354EDB4C
MKNIPFNAHPKTGNECYYIEDAILNRNKLSGDGFYAKQCQKWFNEKLGCVSSLMMPNCTQALELAAILIDIKEGDEVIMPSYTFVSTANAFVLRGAKVVFVDVRPDTMNIDETKIEAAISAKTKAIVPVHYAGVACEMDTIMGLASKYNLFVIEDAAQGMMATYKGRALGTIGHLGAFSFHETKNYTSGGEGGLLIVNDKRFAERAEVIREKGTNRSQFFRGMVDKYTWVDIGSSYLPSEIQSAYLWAQLENADLINSNRLVTWNKYFKAFSELEAIDLVKVPVIPHNSEHNAHMFYLKLNNIEERTSFIDYMINHGVSCVFHYIPLHSAPAGLEFGSFSGEDEHTTIESEKLVRLPIWYGMNDEDTSKIIRTVIQFFD